MKYSEAIRRGLTPPPVEWKRYGWNGSDDLASWLEGRPLLDIDYTAFDKTTVTPLRPDQTKFRDDVIEAYGGRCAITGCSTLSALDAAHLTTWRGGNDAKDGILLRADLHRLFDAKLMEIRDGRVWLEESARKDWPDIHGSVVIKIAT